MNRQTQVVGILGGMGPAAGADFARLFVQSCAELMQQKGWPVSDQSFPEHWLAQIPVPDRSNALNHPGYGDHQPLEPMLQAMGKLAALGSTAVAVACNTAHAWHGALQARFPQLEVLHVAREVADSMKSRGIQEIGLLATEGTYRSRLYEKALGEAGVLCHVPTTEECQQLMRGIYDGVKGNRMDLAHKCFLNVAQAMINRHQLPALVLGCTEIPLALKALPGGGQVELIDPAVVLAQALASRALR